MEKKEENNTEINQSFKLSAIVGIWESLNLHPTVMIYQSKKKYFLSMLHVSDNGQAKPAVCVTDRCMSVNHSNEL